MQAPEGEDYLVDLHAQISDKLALRNLRYTSGRKQLVEVLARSSQPMALPDIVAADPELAQSSVYRNLDLLVRIGVISRINSGGDRVHFELAEPLLGHHHHMICISCGTIRDIYLESEVEDLVGRNLDKIALHTGFTPVHHSLDLHGLCTDC